MANACKRLRYGDLWQLRVRLHGRDHYRHMHGSAVQAEAALAAFRSELERDGAPTAAPSTPFASWAETYLALRPHFAPQTLATYRAILDRHLLPALGTRRLSSLHAADAIALQRALLDRKLHPSTVAGALRLAVAILDAAVRARVLVSNPFARIDRVRARTARRDVLAPDRFAALNRLGDGRVADLLRLALATGARRGELLALRWRDIAPDLTALAISGSLESTTGTIRRKDPKTPASRRTVGLPATITPLLQRRRLAARTAALAAGRDWLDLPVLPAADGLSWWSCSTASHAARRALARLGAPDGLRGLRHAHATALLSSGVNPCAVQRRLGHSAMSTTLGIYGHALPADDTAATTLIDAAMAG